MVTVCGQGVLWPRTRRFRRFPHKPPQIFLGNKKAGLINPAKYIKEDHRKGTIEVGKDADIVVVNDDFDVIATYTTGNKAV